MLSVSTPFPFIFSIKFSLFPSKLEEFDNLQHTNPQQQPTTSLLTPF